MLIMSIRKYFKGTQSKIYVGADFVGTSVRQETEMATMYVFI